MGIFRYWIKAYFFREASESEHSVDCLIREALFDYAFEQAPAGAWDRLRQAIGDTQSGHIYGMWVLDEPLRDPPDVQSTTLTGPEYKRVQRLYDQSQNRWPYGVKPLIWGSLILGFPTYMNC